MESPCTRDRAAAALFLQNIRPFIWRKNLDFAAIQDIHSIKRQIDAHRGRRSAALPGHNVKLGWGGIREIEFITQTQQLIWGFGFKRPIGRKSGNFRAVAIEGIKQ